ncbi:hypothetical protein M3Y95_01023000 [Aphelenchoides besseyi]|nr:hypothetical protein M3Y95_01023000 [Aphelenchoides besseyi]
MLNRLFFFVVLSVAFVSASKPCDGQIVIVLDASHDSAAFDGLDFVYQNTLVKELFTSPYFDDFERLAIGAYSYGTNLTDFGDFHNQQDVADYVDSIQQDSNWGTWLQLGLYYVIEQNYTASPGNLTIIFFVSDLEYYEVDDSRAYAVELQNKGVRLVLIGHGDFNQDFINMDRLAQVTGDPNTVFKWEDGERLPAKDYQDWFKQVLGC